MRAVIQRVTEASVTIDGAVKSKIKNGLVVLLGVEPEDTLADAIWLSKKIGHMRIFSDDKGLMNLSVQDVDGEVMVISQFTLFASTIKGSRPSFIKAAKPEMARLMYEMFCKELRDIISRPIRTGEFGADMKVALVNNGPVTIIMDSKNKE